MARARGFLRSRYGSSGLHLLVTAGSLALAAYVVVELGTGELWDADVWWQSIVVWFLGAVVLHDLVLFPCYALADRLLHKVLHQRRTRGRAGVPVINHVRVPALAIGLLFLLFFPGILGQGASSYARATGQTQDPFLERWLVLSAVIVGLSALGYAARVSWARRGAARSRGGDPTNARAGEPGLDR